MLIVGVLAAGCSPPHPAERHLREARNYFKRDQPDKARCQIEQAIESDTHREQTYWAAMRLYASEERFADAASVGDLLISLSDSREGSKSSDEESAQLYLATGMFHQWSDNLPGAESAYMRALALAPDSPVLLNALGYFYADEGIKLTKALELTNRAVELAPDSAEIIDSLGWAHYRLGNYDQAVMHLKRAVELAPDEAELRYHLGAAYAKHGDKLAARIELRKALILDPDVKDAHTLLNTVQK